jgi:hypothetical protein
VRRVNSGSRPARLRGAALVNTRAAPRRFPCYRSGHEEIANLYVPGRKTNLAASAERYGTALAKAPTDNTSLVSQWREDTSLLVPCAFQKGCLFVKKSTKSGSKWPRTWCFCGIILTVWMTDWPSIHSYILMIAGMLSPHTGTGDTEITGHSRGEGVGVGFCERKQRRRSGEDRPVLPLRPDGV